MSQIFNAFTSELKNGVNLIEASAGTGKTFAIAMLVLKFLVEKNIPIEKILVVTFTHAATNELKNRIRDRICETLQALKKGSSEDENLDLWLFSKTTGVQVNLGFKIVNHRLTQALLEIDQAAIYTIHGFCQRTLQEFALETYQLFGCELEDSVEDLFLQVAEDFWRSHIYYAADDFLTIAKDKFDTPQKLLASVRNAYGKALIYPNKNEINEFDQDYLNRLVEKVKGTLIDFANIFTEENKDKFILGKLNKIKEIVNDPSNLQTLVLLTEENIKSALNGNKFRKSKDLSSDDKKDTFLANLKLDFSEIEKLENYIKKDVIISLRLKLLGFLNKEIPKRLQASNKTSFDELISGLAKVLMNNTPELVNGLRKKYCVAMIDEFQDTDKSQWDIFSSLFYSDKNLTNHYLYLIGDPKQAIYKFRGADIFTYLDAKNKANHHYTLAYNWRSNPDMVKAVNVLFKQRKHPFVLDGLEYTPVKAAKNKLDGYIETYQNGSQLNAAPMQLWFNQDKSQIVEYIANEIISILNGSAKLIKNEKDHKISPEDIAILVSKNETAREYQQILRAKGIPAVVGEASSVFASIDAKNLLIILKAVAEPNNLNFLKEVLTIDIFNISALEYYDYVQDETKLDNVLLRFNSYQQKWIENGFLAMLYMLLEQEQIQNKIIKLEYFERRITDIFHLIELIQEASIKNNLSIHKTIEFLQKNISNSSKNNSSEEQKIRLDSEQATVKIVTMHKSKGLEYPIIFCPDLCRETISTKKINSIDLISCNNGAGLLVDLGSKKFQQNLQQSIKEDLSEKVRLLYVALTRAKYRCYLIWNPVSQSDNLNFASHSPFSYLFNLISSKDNEVIKTKLFNLAEKSPELFYYQELGVNKKEQETLLNTNYKASRSISLKCLISERNLNENWQISSYTSLSKLTYFSDKSFLENEIVIDEDKQLTKINFNSLPKGINMGNVIHELLERNSFENLACLPENYSIDDMQRNVCQNHSVVIDDSELFQTLLKNIVITPIYAMNNRGISTNFFSLSDICSKDSIKEMPFFLTISKFNTKDLNSILRVTSCFKKLTYTDISGFLTGFIDLIFKYNDRYYIADYKSNYLDNYVKADLIEDMSEHNYGLQYWIYSLVLHKYLNNKLLDYDYDINFGGVYYLYVRGMNPNIPMSGIYANKPSLEILTQLDKLIK